MVTFSDMTTLLMTFFVLLISMSSLDSKAVQEISGYFNDAAGVLEFGQMQSVSKPVSSVSPNMFEDIDRLNKSLNQSLETVGLGGLKGKGRDFIEVRQDERGMAMIISGDILFDEGASGLKRESLMVLSAVAQTLQNLDSTISIEGHTDSSGTAEEQYRISLQRAGSVLDYFLYSAGLSSAKFCLGGYGQAKPVATNATSDGRRKNNRVEIIVLKSKI